MKRKPSAKTPARGRKKKRAPPVLKGWWWKAHRNVPDALRQFGRMISELQKIFGLSWPALARHAGVDENRLRRIVAGQAKNLTLREASNIARGLGVTLSIVLVGGDVERAT